MAEKKSDLLSSWKEVAAYLDCGIRTAHRWEHEYGMPVHRLGQGSRARVFAYKDELDTWLANRVAGESGKTKKYTFASLLLVFSIVLILSGTGYFVYRYLTFDREPYGFNIHRSTLIVLNRDGRELWRKDFRLGSNLNEAYYRERFQQRKVVNGKRMLPALQFEDINRDGKKEVLFGICEIPAGRFFCFSHKGDELWAVQTGQELTFGSKIYTNDYRIAWVRTEDLDGNGYYELLLASNQVDEFPTQILLLSHEGETLGEYWHSGRLGDVIFSDLNGDGRKDIVVAGVNNQFDSPGVAVFDAHQVSGASPNTGEYACPALGPGSEKHYIRLPFTEAAEAAYPLEISGYIMERSAELWSVFTYPTSLEYRFDNEFQLLEIRDSHQFEMLFRQAQAAGSLGGTGRLKYVEQLKERVRWHDGDKWVAEPAMRNQWGH